MAGMKWAVRPTDSVNCQGECEISQGLLEDWEASSWAVLFTHTDSAACRRTTSRALSEAASAQLSCSQRRHISSSQSLCVCERVCIKAAAEQSLWPVNDSTALCQS